MQLYLVRHARPDSANSVCYGRKEVCVSPQATAAAAESVRRQLPPAVLRAAPIYSSPLSRCQQLALTLAASRTVQVTEDLVELSFGRWEGQRWDCVPRDEIDAWNEDLWDYRPGEGESARMARARWLSWLVRLPTSEAVVVVTHAGLIRVALASRGRTGACLTDPVAYASVHVVARSDYVVVEPV
jgi:alpha-ribazole phosphatase